MLVSATTPATPRTRVRARRRAVSGYYWYLLPAGVGFAAIIFIPFIANIIISFTSWSGAGPLTFVGLSNYTTLFQDTLFWQSFLHSVVFIFAMAIIPTALGLLMAAVLFDYIAPRFGARTASALRAAFYLPQILPIIVAGVLWGWLLQPDNGAVNTFFRAIGLGSFALNWLGQPTSALLSITAILIWLQIGYCVVIFMSGMSRIDPALHEAAELDGASWLQRFRVITVNQLRPEIAVVLLTTTVAALKVFAPIYAVTRGGPGTATYVPSYFSFFSFFTQSRVGYGSAIATILAILIGALAIVLLRFQNPKGDEA